MTGRPVYPDPQSPAGDTERGAANATVICTALAAAAMDRLRLACDAHVLSELGRSDHSDSCWRADVLCIDPLVVQQDRALHTQVIALASAGIPCAFYTESSPRALRAVADTLAMTPVRLFLFGVDDSREELAALPGLSARGRYCLDLLRALAPLTSSLPPGIREAIEQVQRLPQQFFDANDVARRAGLSRRHVDRLLHAHRLAPAKSWVIAARAFHAVRLLAIKRCRVTVIANELGYADEKALRRHVTAVWGLTPQEAAARDAGTLLGQLVTFVADTGELALVEP